MGYSRIQLWQYITGILLILLLAWHFSLRIPQLRGVESFIETLQPGKIYSDIGGATGILGILLAYAALFHGLNGLRGILLEWLGEGRRTLINLVAVILFIIFAGIATYTVIGLTNPGA